ncbi:stalk domain-containing protein [Paenibacillus methanolicus]|uniref:NHL repeat-containing protein n=1 Tax=Paenibacillus methanolicus TaxID=582686 RepID=A0A5S5C5N6_9BACL|nr:stalk domain-containing protein [Paenibacillus methanolicus]TYP73782.1 NHL repeat-containing protein [Paenibacillus methanolicus]
MKNSLIMAALGSALLLTTVEPAAAAGASASALETKKSLYEIHTLAGSGEYAYREGKGSEATFNQPTSLLAVSGSLVLADTHNQRIRTIAADGATSTLAGTDWASGDWDLALGGLNDGKIGESVLNEPGGLAADANGNMYIADTENHAIRKLDRAGMLTTIAGNGAIGSKDGQSAEARFYHPLDVAVTADGIIYVADTLNHVIRKIEAGKVSTIGTPPERAILSAEEAELAGNFADGPLAGAKFNEPSGLALDAKGNLFVSDTGNQRIRYIDFGQGVVTTVAGGRTGLFPGYGEEEAYVTGDYADGVAAEAKFNAPRGLAVTSEGGLLIADSLNHAIRYLKDGVVTTLAGTPGDTGRVDGVASASGFNKPTDVAWLGGDSFAVADAGNNRIGIVRPYALPAGLKKAETIHLLLDRQRIATDAAPVVMNAATFVPVRVITEQLGFTVQYREGKTVLTRGELSYTVTAKAALIAKSEAGKTQNVKLSAVPFYKEGRLFVPVRFFAEEAELDVQWLSDVGAVLMRHKQFS